MINEDNDNNVQRPRPEFLNHFDQKDKEKVLEKSTETGNSINNQAFGSLQLNKPKSPEYGNAQAMQQQFQQVPGAGKCFKASQAYLYIFFSCCCFRSII